jgi:hypothetical protein
MYSIFQVEETSWAISLALAESRMSENPTQIASSRRRSAVMTLMREGNSSVYYALDLVAPFFNSKEKQEKSKCQLQQYSSI